MVNVSETLELHSAGLQQTTAIGIWLGQLLEPGDVICLYGDLGAGKTALTGGIGQGWGTLELVNSPTFVFVHEHRRARDNVRLYHIDCYRLSGPDDAESIGIEDILSGDSTVVIEWPERIESLLPLARLDIYLGVVNDVQRQLFFRARGIHFGHLVDELKSHYAAGH